MSMKLPVLLTTRRLAAFVSALLVLLCACNSKKKLIAVDPAFSKYVEAYTSGIISKKSVIRLVLAADARTVHTVNETVSESLFDFSPSVKGKAYWVDARTIEFKPEQDLQPDELYEVSFALDKVMNVPDKFGDFRFNVQVMKPAFAVEQLGLQARDKDQYALTGRVVTADAEENGQVEKLLKATYPNSEVKIAWSHNEATKTHTYTISNIKRTAQSSTLHLAWEGSALGADNKGSKDLYVPAVGEFLVLDVKPMQDADQYVLVQFSDLIAVGQLLDGLITIEGQEQPAYAINGSEIKVFTNGKLDGHYAVKVNAGIQNRWGKKLEKTYSSNVSFESRQPSVKIFGNGSVLPVTGGRLVLPFDAVNLKAVDVSVIKIYENNIAQFLQNNDLNGEYELRRVGRPLVQAVVRLDDDKALDLHRKNRFSLDLDKYIRTEPGAIYRVHIGFRPEYSVYACTEMGKASEESEYDYEYEGRSAAVDDEEQFWERYDSYYPYGYDWEHREDPCHTAYYNKERFAARNIIASNIGLTAKRGTNQTLVVLANHLLTTEPMKGVQLEVLDYQQQVIATGSTDGDGMATLSVKRKPYLLVAKNGATEKGYLKLDEGTALPLSRFDIEGAEVQNGIKGFVFGERGVWRPGDSLFLGCIVEDQAGTLPAGHPVEMELVSPRGQLYKKLVQPNAANGFNVFRTATSADAPTGNWLCRVKVGGATFEKKLKIETVMPNRLKINLDFHGQEALGRSATEPATLNARWLFGATAQHLKARVDVQLYKRATAFDKYKGYVFDNPTANFAPQSKVVFDGPLDAEGNATLNPQFEAGEQAPGQLLANVMVKVFEPGGNFSIDNLSMPYNPYSAYVGVKVPEGDKQWGFLQTGKTHRFTIAEVTPDGKPTTGTTEAEVEIYKISWRWWWDNSGEGLSNFTQDQYNKLVSDKRVTLVNGAGYYDISPADEEWGRYLVLVKDQRSGHVTGTTFYVDGYGWQSRNNSDMPSAAAMLSFTSDKEKYQVGDDVKLTIPSSEGGRALISIETGSRVLKTFWTKTTAKETRFSFPVEKEMAPNVYVNVSLVQPHAQTVNDLPIRMYGVIPVLVEDPKSRLEPVIRMPDVVRPQTPVNLTVSEAKGRKMTYVIAVVDEGLLDLTRFKTPDPHEAFYAREALGVKSWDLYDYVIGAWGGQLERILTIGGDGEGDLAAKTRRANRFKPVVQFLGPFESSGSRTHTITLPNYMGSVRTMVIAAGEHAYGMAEKAVQVKKPLMLLTTLPRVLGPGEEVKIPVTVFATDPSIRSATLSIQSNPYIQATGTQTVQFSTGQEQQLYFTARVLSRTGIGTIKVVASAGKETASAETELDIRNPNSLVTQVTEAELQPGQSWNNTVARIGEGATSRAVLEVSSMPAMNLEKRLDYLVEYPHGCIEQTTSAVFPQLVLNQLLDLTEKQQAEVERNIRAGLQKLQHFRTADGGFAYWPGDRQADEWGTDYAGHFMLEAAARGYNVPSDMLQQWRSYERTKAQAWNLTTEPYYGSDLVQAYRLYLLALARAPELGAMNRLKEYRFLKPEARWRLAAAYHLAGQKSIALNLISNLPETFPERTDWGISYGSALRDEAMVLETLTLMDRKAEAGRLVRRIAAKLAQDNWYSTQTTAYALIALAGYAGRNSDGAKVKVSGKINAAGFKADVAKSIVQQEVAWQNGKAGVQLTNTGSNVLYVRVINQGQPLATAAQPAIRNPQVLQLQVAYLDAGGQPLDIRSLKQGTDFVAKVTVTNPGNRGTYTAMALTQVFPGGWEILNTRLYNSEGVFKSSPSNYLDIRDDRVYHYFDLAPHKSVTYYVQLNAAYPGRYYWPGVYAEAMYDHNISAAEPGQWVEVGE